MTRKTIKHILVALTTIAAAWNLMILFAGLSGDPNAGYAFIVLMFSSFTSGFVLLVLWSIYFTGRGVLRSANSRSKDKGSRAVRVLANVIIFLYLFGSLLIVLFILHGGPNKGKGSHLFNNSDNLYMDMQVGIALILLAVMISIYSRVRAHKRY